MRMPAPSSCPSMFALLLRVVLWRCSPPSMPYRCSRTQLHSFQTSNQDGPHHDPVTFAARRNFVVVAAWPAAAHGPTPQKVEEKITLKAKPDAVWAVIKDFAAFASWHPGIEKCEATGGNVAGATRTITLKSNGKSLVEGLDEYAEAEKMYGYRLSTENIEALPVSFYSATLKVVPAEGGSEVQWEGRFYRADTSNFPPENLNDEAAVKAMTAFFQEGLKGLKEKLGEK